jgi:ABC-type ATPase involved in cell division
MAREVMDLFRAINRMATTVVVATHDNALVEYMGKRVMKLENGRIWAGAR